MSPLEPHHALSLADALVTLAEPGAQAMAGGTDLLALIEQELAHPLILVDVRSIPELLGTDVQQDGSLRIGASVTLADLAAHEDVRARFPLLAAACESIATPAIRASSTLAGALLQRPQCGYFRRAVPCFKNGGASCPALEGDNRHLAILDGGPCYIVHPSDVAVALVALDAAIDLAGPEGARTVDAADFFVPPRERLDREDVLREGELVVSVRLPASAAGGLQRYRKSIESEAWPFALASVAAARRVDGDVRLVLGGLAPRPYRVYNSVEEETMTGGLDEDTIEGLAERALLDAEPLSENGYKLELAALLLRDAIREIAAG